jgi:hypothetical protein
LLKLLLVLVSINVSVVLFFSVCVFSSGTPHRWQQYDEELSACFARIEETFLMLNEKKDLAADLAPPPLPLAHPAPPPSAAAHTRTIADADADAVILRRALELFYLWTTFAPLSRGTAACGYAAFCGVLLSFGRKVRGRSSLLPSNVQLDWEAILAVDFESFWEKSHAWFTLEDASSTFTAMEVAHPWNRDPLPLPLPLPAPKPRENANASASASTAPSSSSLVPPLAAAAASLSSTPDAAAGQVAVKTPAKEKLANSGTPPSSSSSALNKNNIEGQYYRGPSSATTSPSGSPGPSRSNSTIFNPNSTGNAVSAKGKGLFECVVTLRDMLDLLNISFKFNSK